MEFKDYLKVVRARWPLIAIAAAVCIATALVITYFQKPSYQGVAEIVVSQQNTGITMLGTPQPDQPYQPGRDDVQTQAEVVSSARMARQVIKRLRLKATVEELLANVSATADSGTSIVTVRATDGSPARAAEIANAFAEGYIAWSRESQQSSIRAATNDVQARLNRAQEEILELQKATDDGVAAQVRLQSAKDLYASLSDKLEELRIAEQLSTGKGSLLTSAVVDRNRVSPSYRKNLMLALALGLLYGLAAVFIAEQLDSRIKTADDAAEICGAPVLAIIPSTKDREEGPAQTELIQRSDNAEAQAYRMLRNNLEFAAAGRDVKTVLVTSAVPNEGKSTVAANLALVLAQAGKRVRLIACDFWLPGADRYYAVSGEVGLADVLAGTATVEAALQRPPGVDNLEILPAGPNPPNPSELLASMGMGDLLKALRASSDWVILDSSPVLATADAAAVARWVDATLMVARVGMSRRETLKSGCGQFRHVGVPVLGMVVLAPVEFATASGYYGYHRGSGRGYPGRS